LQPARMQVGLPRSRADSVGEGRLCPFPATMTRGSDLRGLVVPDRRHIGSPRPGATLNGPLRPTN